MAHDPDDDRALAEIADSAGMHNAVAAVGPAALLAALLGWLLSRWRRR